MDLQFAIEGAAPDAYAAAPSLNFRLRITASQPVHAILLRVLLQIEPRRRRHSAGEAERMTDLFGEPERWAETLRPLVWTRMSVTTPSFDHSIEIDLPAACTYDFEVASAKYLHALEDADVPLLFLFSGTVFLKAETGFQVQQIPWNKEAAYRLPIRFWREALDAHFPGFAWIRLRRESLDALNRYRLRRGLLNWDEVIEAITESSAGAAR
ncbi:MAG TPA: DUF6084 family protein [Bryobacteraceae bacterium]|nr:DUF6084 family protein [Bryobacteraceae bacterium]